jgi:Ring finger domain
MFYVLICVLNVGKMIYSLYVVVFRVMLLLCRGMSVFGNYEFVVFRFEVDMETTDARATHKQVIESLPRLWINRKKPCAICLARLKKKQACIALPCHRTHVFHEDCLLQWLQNNHTCPTCRYRFLSQGGYSSNESDSSESSGTDDVIDEDNGEPVNVSP